MINRLPIAFGIVLLLLTLALRPSSSCGQTPSNSEGTNRRQHRVVFQITSSEQTHWGSLLNNVENVRKALGEDKTAVLVVVHGNALGLVTKDSQVKERVQKISEAGVVFTACENTMIRKNVPNEDLLRGIATIDSGVAEVVRKQEEGWSYLKSDG